IDVGSSGAETDSGPTGLQYHFIWVTIDSTGITIAPIKKGSVLSADELLSSELKLIDKMNNWGVTFEKPLPIGGNLALLGNETKVKLRNLNSQLALTDTLRWEISPGWSVEPPLYPLNIKAGDSLLTKFTFKLIGSPYPAPTLWFHFSYAQGKPPAVVKTPLVIIRETDCYRAAVPPIIDGELSEAVWKSPNTRLFAPDGTPVRVDSTSFYFAYDDSNLYLGALCYEPKMDSMTAAVTDRDGPIYMEDCVGYFFQPDRHKGLVYQIYFNPLGTPFDQKIVIDSNSRVTADRTWNGNYEVKTTKGGHSWSLEARIPLSQLGAAMPPGFEWGINFRRKQPRVASAADWQVPLDANPKLLGRLVIE
ncbi:MAG: hypothetical protein NTV06_04925, partial [candidate division Zixibacteria bacterium]|nr:hypothetical protein [candidate division Zixibacteria bacterium]